MSCSINTSLSLFPSASVRPVRHFFFSPIRERTPVCLTCGTRQRQHVSTAVSPCCFQGHSSFMVRFLSRRPGGGGGGERRERDLLRQVKRRCRVTDAGEDGGGGGGGEGAGGRRGVRTRTSARFRWERKGRTDRK